MEYLKSAWRSLFRKKFRTILTLISIAIGVASVVLISMIGDTGKGAINEEINALGLGNLSVSAVQKSAVTLDETDLERVQQMDFVDDAVPIMMEYTDAVSRGLICNVVAWGIDAGDKQIISLDLLHGSLFTKEEVSKAQKVCLVDEEYAQSVYKRSNIVGKTIKVRLNGVYEELKVIGVVASGGNMLQSLLTDYIPSFIYLPYSTLQQTAARHSFDQIAVKVEPDYDLDMAITRLEHMLNAQNANSYRVENTQKTKQTFYDILNIVTMVLSLIAGISLMVAGLGIMTVMLSAVSERTREIGIKKSIGAKQKNILLEFLVEAFTISLIGSIIGCISGLSLMLLAGWLLGIAVSVNVSMILFCVLFTVCIGMVFGVYPAYRASKLLPVDALRFE